MLIYRRLCFFGVNRNEVCCFLFGIFEIKQIKMGEFKKEREFIHYLFKRGKSSYMTNFVEKGELYFNTLENMKGGEKDCHRQDSEEGRAKREILKNTKVDIYKCGECLDTAEPVFSLGGVDTIIKSDFINGNIYSLAGIFNDQLSSEQRNLEIDIRDFGESLIVIQNPRLFMERVFKELGKLNLNYKIGRVRYYDESYSGKLSPFCKRIGYSCQSEFRIFISSEKKPEPIKIYIGDLRDIATKIDVPIQMKLNLTDGNTLFFEP